MINQAKHIEKVYRTSDEHIDRSNYLRLDKNERIKPFSANFLNTLREKVNDEVITMYPDPEPLYQRLAEWLGIDRKCLYLSSGSEYSIKAIFEAFMDRKDKILLHSPSYAMYNVYSDVYGVKQTTLEYKEDLSFNLNEYTSMIDSSYKMVVLENPNGFIGNSYRLQDIIGFLDATLKHSVLAVIDEAYFHFYPITVLELILKYENLCVVRTFSKAFGLAGVRFGYLVAQSKIVQSILKVRPMHEINSFSIMLGLHCLENLEEMNDFIKEVHKSKAYTIDGLKKKGIEVRNSDTNFILVKFPEGIDVQKCLFDEGILVRRPFTQKFLKGWTRVTIGSSSQMKEMIKLIG